MRRHAFRALDVLKQWWPQKNQLAAFYILSETCRPHQALRSMEQAVQDRLGRADRSNPHVRTLWACENDPICQQVLKDTFGVCVFGDIMDMGAGKQNLFCFTHNKLCPCTVPKVTKRNLVCLETKNYRIGIEWWWGYPNEICLNVTICHSHKLTSLPPLSQLLRNPIERRRLGDWTNIIWK